MTTRKRFQIPVLAEEMKLVKDAAKLYQIPAAEWARRVLTRAAERDLTTAERQTPKQAVAKIGKLNAPIDSLERMIEESLAGRLK